jgi:hypothetical protein
LRHATPLYRCGYAAPFHQGHGLVRAISYAGHVHAAHAHEFRNLAFRAVNTPCKHPFTVFTDRAPCRAK